MRKRSWEDRKNRKCPDCGRIIYYSRKDAFDRAVGNNSVCKSCAQIDRKVTLNMLEQMKAPKSNTHKEAISYGMYKKNYKKYIEENIGLELLTLEEYILQRKHANGKT